jgi:GNAT superfamily N-acetyltransferase
MIRRLKREEIPIIAEHYQKRMGREFKKVGEKPITKERYEKILRGNFENSFMFVFEDKGIKSFIWFVKEDNEINLEEIFSIEKGKEYGKKLMNFLLDFSKKEKTKKINIDVHFKNEEALNFFKKLGFTERTVELSLDI